MSAGPVRPAPSQDLDSPGEIAELVRRFYQDVAQDDLLGPMFEEVAHVDWVEHLPKLTAFWCRALLGIEGYSGNPFRAHALINDQAPFTMAHFERWLELFHDAVELGWTGPNAQRALDLAHNVARVHAGQLVRDRASVLVIGPPVVNPTAPSSGRTRTDAEGLGGDRPCWQGSIEDHRDEQSKADLSTPAQVHDLVTIFYREIVFDDLLAPIFDEVAEVDWAEHIPRLIDYWCWILFGGTPYGGAVTRTHRHLHGLRAIEPGHCDRWFALWAGCIDERWSGPGAEHAKHHAQVLMAGMAKRIFGFEWPIPATAIRPNR